MAILQINLEQPATFQTSPGAESIAFDSLRGALVHAMNRGSNRHPRSVLVTSGGEHLGWKDIDDLIARFKLSNIHGLPPAPPAPRSSRL